MLIDFKEKRLRSIKIFKFSENIGGFAYLLGFETKKYIKVPDFWAAVTSIVVLM